MSGGQPTSKRWEGPRFVPQPQPTARPTSFNRLLRYYRVMLGLSQNQLARLGGVDPAYVNRLERAADDSTSLPSRKVVFSLHGAIRAEALNANISIGEQDLERMLVAAGLVPETIRAAGGWDAYLLRIRGRLADAYDQLNQALTEVPDAD